MIRLRDAGLGPVGFPFPFPFPFNERVSIVREDALQTPDHPLQDAGAGVLQWMVWGLECVLAHDRHAFIEREREREREPDGSETGVSETDQRLWTFLADRFAALKPWRVRVADVFVLVDDGSGALALSSSPPDTIVGSVVGLCKVDTGIFGDEKETSGGETSEKEKEKEDAFFSRRVSVWV